MKKITTLILALMVSVAFSQTQTRNGGMENWRSYYLPFNQQTAIEIPNSWSSFDSIFNVLGHLSNPTSTVVFKTVSQSTLEKHSGNSSVKLVSQKMNGFGVISGYLTNTSYSLDPNTYDIVGWGGEPINGRVTSVSAWVKYLPANKDKAYMYIEVFNHSTFGVDTVVGYGFVNPFGATTNFTKIDISTITYTNTLKPELLRFYFSNTIDTVQNSSTLYVDDISYTIDSTITNLINIDGDWQWSVYPNPTYDKLNIKGIENCFSI